MFQKSILLENCYKNDNNIKNSNNSFDGSLTSRLPTEVINIDEETDE